MYCSLLYNITLLYITVLYFTIQYYNTDSFDPWQWYPALPKVGGQDSTIYGNKELRAGMGGSCVLW